jgi:TubC N-terminal docking domain
MSPTLLAQLTRRGIRLRRAGDQLGVTADPETLTPEATDFLRKYKDALLAGLPSFPTWPPTAVSRAVESRAAALQKTDFTGTEADLQAAHEALNLNALEPHPEARCLLHGCAQRKLPRSDLYRCPACVPGAFAGRGKEVKAA